ncbi:hypothetical protein O6H91_05G067100 [Diphasiastrum complanatum]|uniref:Uncharacterized protein n=1 Tax=Diphasiastrum complanatum TaxID=34168 RepID=A0ACC2DP22_DIPCM|nr:hypothetical protein O6H91_05G067100 [Diphasiastrum complanatum]
MILRLRSFYPSSSFSSSCRHAWKGQYPTLTSRLHVSSSIARCQEPLNTKARHMKHISNLRVNLAILKEKRKEKNHSGRTPVARVVTNSIKEKGQQNDMSFYESLNMSSMSNKEVHAPTNGVMDEEGSNYSSSTTVDALLIRFLTGKGKPKDQIEKDTGTSIKVTSTHEGKAASVVDVKGHSEWAVQEALKRIQEVLNEAVKSQLQYTHFISLPLAIHPTLVEKLWSFQESVLALSSKCGGNADDHATELDSQSCEKDVANEISITSSSELTKTRSAIEKSIFVNPATFHLTVLMLKLWTEEQLKVAVEVLKVRVQPVSVMLRHMRVHRS